MSASRASTNPEVPIRHMEFDFDESQVPKYCWNNNAWGSAYILTFSAVLPSGERFIIDAVRELRDRATGLIGQEAIHSRIHERFNEIHELKGLPMQRIQALSHRLYVEGIRYWFNHLVTFSPKLLRYFRPGFHPDDSDTTELLNTWRKRLFGKRGSLARRVTKTVRPGDSRLSGNRTSAHDQEAASQ